MSTNLQRVLGLNVEVSAVVAERDMTIESILELAPGVIIEFERTYDAELTLHVVNRKIASGKAVKIGENFGLKIINIEPVRTRIEAFGPIKQ